MNIVHESTGTLEAVIKVQLGKEDYQEKVSGELKNMQRKAQMPGFRPGKVPYGMIQKMYGKSVLVEEVNKVLADAVFQYIKEKELNILGQPVPDHKEAEKIDWDDLNGFTFKYHIGLAPEFEIDLASGIEVPYHKIKVEDDMVNSYLADIRRQYGKMTSPEVSSIEDVLFGEFCEMESPDQEKPDGKTHKSNLFIQYIKDEELQSRLVGIRAGDTVLLDIIKAVESASESAAMIGVKKEELSNYSPLFRFTLDSISHVEPAEMNEELYNKLAPGKGIHDESSFRELLREQISQQYQADVDKHFKNEVRKKLIDLTSLALPLDFLKMWLLDANRDSFTPEQVEKEFDNLADTFRWQLIENHLIKRYELKVAQQEIHEHLEQYFRQQMKQYGQQDVEQEVIDGFVKNISSKEEEVKKVYDHLYDQKLLGLYKTHLSLQETELSFGDFVKLMNEKYKTDEPETDPLQA